MPSRGGRAGGGSRGGRSMGGFRVPRASAGSSGGFKGFRIPTGNHTPRVETDSITLNPAHHRPFLRSRTQFLSGTAWKIIAVIIALFVFGGCSCVGLGFLLQALGYGQ